MDNQIQGEVTGRVVFAPWHPELILLKESLHAVTLSAMRDAGISIYGIGGASCEQLDGRRMTLKSVGTRRAISAAWIAKCHRTPTSIRASSAARPHRLLQHPADCVCANPRKCCIGGGTAEVMRQVISNALRPKVRKAN